MSSIRIYDCTFNITPIWWLFSKLKFAQTVIHVWRQKRSVCPHTHAVMDIGTKSEQNMQKDLSWTRNMCMYTCAEMKWNGIIAYRRVRCTYKQGKCVSICAEKKCSTECSKICRCSEMECAAATAGHDLPRADLRCILSYQKNAGFKTDAVFKMWKLSLWDLNPFLTLPCTHLDIVIMYEVCSVRANLKSVLTPCYTIRLRPWLERSAVLAEVEDQEAGKLPSKIAWSHICPNSGIARIKNWKSWRIARI